MRMYSYVAKKLFRKVHKLKDMWFLLREGGPTAQKTVTDHLHVQLIPFDKPDLAKWNYRNLKNTPIENAKKYQKISKDIDKRIQKFEKKYSTKSVTPVIAVDALIVNKKNEVLLAKKRPEFAKDKNEWVLPGGRVDPSEVLETALIREVEEETGVKISKNSPELVSSVLTDTSFQKVKRIHKERFLINTYTVRLNKNPAKVNPGDDIGELRWFSVKDALKVRTVFDKKLLENI
jgi:8-oxo-dGTP pyrophosphatase MutT (NUDIX family)